MALKDVYLSNSQVEDMSNQDVQKYQDLLLVRKEELFNEMDLWLATYKAVSSEINARGLTPRAENEVMH